MLKKDIQKYSSITNKLAGTIAESRTIIDILNQIAKSQDDKKIYDDLWTFIFKSLHSLLIINVDKLVQEGKRHGSMYHLMEITKELQNDKSDEVNQDKQILSSKKKNISICRNIFEAHIPKPDCEAPEYRFPSQREILDILEESESIIRKYDSWIMPRWGHIFKSKYIPGHEHILNHISRLI